MLSSKQKNISEAYVESEEREDRQMGNFLQISQLTSVLYDPTMKDICCLSEAQISSRLRNHGITYDKSKFYATFDKCCIRTDWQSTVYEVRYGYFRTELKTISVRLDSSVFCNNFLDGGNFGEILAFEKSIQQHFVLKNIKYQTNNGEKINLALQQVFFAKVFSALETGPKFVQLFSYDLIIFKNTVQFAMELCRTDFNELELKEEINTNNLLKLLKTIHSLGICHMDIKILNLGWSPAFKKLVFLDFTFTRFVKESIGYKTMTAFFGTNKYSSPEMRKRFQLQDKSYVDLYYNDLHCLEQTWKEMRSVPTRTFYLQLDALQDKNQNNYAENQAIISYFQAKSHIFDDDLYNLTELVKKEKLLRKTLSKMLRKYEKKRNISHDYRTCSCHNNIQNEEPPASFCQIDQILYSYEISTEDNPFIVSLSDLLKEVTINDKMFEKAWREDVYKQSMFFFIDVYYNSIEDKDNESQTERMVEKIYHQICNIEPSSYTIKFHQVLLFYASYFINKEKSNLHSNPVLENQTLRKNILTQIQCQFDVTQSETSSMIRFRRITEYYASYLGKNKNIELVEKIMGYFVLMHDRQTRKKLEDMVLSILEQQEDYSEYNERNFKYFLAEIATMNSISTWDLQRYIQRSQNLIKHLVNKIKPTDPLLLEISQTPQLLKMIKNYKIGKLFKIDLTQQLKQIASLLNKKDKQIKDFTSFILLFQKSPQLTASIVKKQKMFKSSFLEKCAFQMFIMSCIMTEEYYSLKTTIPSQPFLQKFPTLTNLNILNTNIKTNKQKRVQICQNYLKMQKDPGCTLSPSLSISLSSQCQCLCQYLMVLEQLYDEIYVAGYLVDWFVGLRMSFVGCLDRLWNVKIGLQVVIFYLLNIKFYGTGEKVPLKTEKKLGEAILSFIQYTIDLPSIIKHQSLNPTSPSQTPIFSKPQITTQINLKDMYQKALALLLLNRVEQAITIALQIADRSIEVQFYGYLFGFFCYVEDCCRGDWSERGNCITVRLIQKIVHGQFCQNLLQSYTCLYNLMRPLKRNGMIDEAFNCIRELCCYVESKNINVTNTNLFSRITQFLQIWSIPEIKQFVQTRIKWSLSEFISCPALTYILHKASQQFRLEQTQRKRLVVLLVMFVRSLPHGSFADYRQILYWDSYQLKKRKIRTLTQLRRLAFQNTITMFTETFASPRKGKHKSFFSREAADHMVKSTTRKAKDYYKNCKGKIKTTDDNSCPIDSPNPQQQQQIH